jgi:hypothetical protein
MISGAVSHSIQTLGELRNRNIPLFTLTNWPAETFAPQPARFDFLAWDKRS